MMTRITLHTSELMQQNGKKKHGTRQLYQELAPTRKDSGQATRQNEPVYIKMRKYNQPVYSLLYELRRLFIAHHYGK